jgi:ketosteroid isomerase-like protein
VASENAAIVQRAFEAFNRGDFEDALAYVDEEIEWGHPPDMPDVDRPWDSPDALVQGMSRFVVAWTGLRADIERIADVGDRVVVDTRWSGRSRGTGIEVDQRIAQVYELREGKILRVRQFRTHEEALEAAAD